MPSPCPSLAAPMRNRFARVLPILLAASTGTVGAAPLCEACGPPPAKPSSRTAVLAAPAAMPVPLPVPARAMPRDAVAVDAPDPGTPGLQRRCRGPASGAGPVETISPAADGIAWVDCPRATSGPERR